MIIVLFAIVAALFYVIGRSSHGSEWMRVHEELKAAQQRVTYLETVWAATHDYQI